MDDAEQIQSAAVDATEAGNLTTWPNWILDAGPDIPSSLVRIEVASQRFRASTQNGYRHRHVMQAKLNQELDALIASGDLNPKGGSNTNLRLSRDVVLHSLYNHGSASRVLGQLCFVKQAVLVHCLEAARADLLANNLIGTLTIFRSIIEQIAHFDAIIRKVQSYPSPGDYKGANKALVAMSSTLLEMANGSRVDWRGLLQGGAAERLIRKETKYQPQPNRIDVEADGILNAVDGITKKVPGVRGVYEVLCEFAHPNAGSILGLMKSVEAFVDPQGVHWVTKELTLGAPIAAANEMGEILNFVFQTLANCIALFEELLKSADIERSKARRLAQILTRTVAHKNPGLLSPYDLCPCDSNKKVRFCCGGPRRQSDAT